MVKMRSSLLKNYYLCYKQAKIVTADKTKLVQINIYTSNLLLNILKMRGVCALEKVFLVVLFIWNNLNVKY